MFCRSLHFLGVKSSGIRMLGDLVWVVADPAKFSDQLFQFRYIGHDLILYDDLFIHQMTSDICCKRQFCVLRHGDCFCV